MEGTNETEMMLHIMKAKMTGTMVGCYRGFQFEIPKGTICEVIQVKNNIVYVAWEDELAAIYEHYVEYVN